MSVAAIIPARLASTRLPGKPLCDIHGRPLIQHVWERVRACRSVDQVLVATDDAGIAAAVRGFGGQAVLTSPSHRSGTDRLAEAAAGLSAEVLVNVQGDEPLLDPSSVDAAVSALLADPTVQMATLSAPLTDLEEMLSASVVKVVSDARGDALYFSRSPIPHLRQGSGADLRAAAAAAVAAGLAHRHVGLYVYRREALLRFAALPPAPLEEAEGLEQLRALHHGWKLRVVAHPTAGGPAVDTPEDLARVRALLAGSRTGWTRTGGRG